MIPKQKARDIVLAVRPPLLPCDRELFDLYRAQVVSVVAAALTERDREIERLGNVAEARREIIEAQDRKLLVYKGLVLLRPYTIYTVQHTEPVPLHTAESFSAMADERDTLRAHWDALVEALRKRHRHGNIADHIHGCDACAALAAGMGSDE